MLVWAAVAHWTVALHEEGANPPPGRIHAKAVFLAQEVAEGKGGVGQRRRVQDAVGIGRRAGNALGCMSIGTVGGAAETDVISLISAMAAGRAAVAVDFVIDV